MSNFCVVLWTAKNLSEAKKISRVLVESKLIACATLLDNAQSIYLWDGKVKIEKEVQVIIKTLKSNFSKIKKEIEINCSYETPEIIAIGIEDGLSRYLNWIKDTTS